MIFLTGSYHTHEYSHSHAVYDDRFRSGVSGRMRHLVDQAHQRLAVRRKRLIIRPTVEPEQLHIHLRLSALLMYNKKHNYLQFNLRYISNKKLFSILSSKSSYIYVISYTLITHYNIMT